MPELKHHFRLGRMNKDLDERLVPNGEYRDALNVQVATSEGSDVGALQNILGNQVRSSVGITGATCIGSIDDQENDMIYWFICGSSVNAVVEYDVNARIVSPVLVDTSDVMKFNKNKLITGINLIDGLLFFTDDNSEPKVINIEKFKNGSSNFSTHTVLLDQSEATYNFTEEDVTVIKAAPETAPTLTMFNTKRVDSSGNPLTVETQYSFDPYYNNEPRAIGSIFTIVVQNLAWEVGDIILSSGGTDGDVFEDEFTASWVVTSSSFYQAVLELTSLPEDIASGSSMWTFKLQQGDPLFEKDFVRFAYRYKYKDGEYSPFSPFSEVAFLPQRFEYDPAQGYNTGMVNDVRFLRVGGFRPSDIPKQVEETELLFKKDISPIVYSVEAFNIEDQEWADNLYEVKTEIIHKVLPSMQLLRPWDNVPLKAKAQELVANRIVYGNYLQQFDLKDSSGRDVKPEFEHFTDPVGFLDPADYSDSEVPPGKSIKSQRTYQLGVVYRDEYGRETPVQTNTSGGFNIPKVEADSYSRIKVKLNNDPPAFATSFKYFIKDASNQYYNLAQDRWYDADDGNIWLSFPSSERNKVDEETFLILKKQHDGNVLVSDPAKYKIVDISNEAPVELKEFKASYGQFGQSFDATDYPRPEATYFEFPKNDWEDDHGENSEILSTSNLVVRIVGSGRRSDWYDIANISLVGNLAQTIRINLSERFENDVAQFYPDDTHGSEVSGIGYEIARIETKNKPEFTGRFFVKVYKDGPLMEYIVNSAAAEQYSIVNSARTSIRRNACGSPGSWQDDGPNSSRKLNWHVSHCNIYSMKSDLSGSGVGQSWASALISSSAWNSSEYRTAPIKIGRDVVHLAFHWARSLTSIRNASGGIHRDFLDRLLTDGTKIRFTSDPNGNVYTIKKSASNSCRQYNSSQFLANDDAWGSNKRRLFLFKLDRPVQDWDIFTDGSFPRSSDTMTAWEIVEEYDASSFRTNNPAIWETEPKEQVELDIYYEASDAYPIAQHGNQQTLNYHNCFSFGNGVESNRIRDDFNASFISKGVKASAPLAQQYKQERRKSGLIYSQIYNSTSGLNGTNQFIMADKVTKDLNPEYGSVQKLHARGTDLLSLCEDKVIKILANKDALFNADGNANITASTNVLGQAIIPPTFGEYGISKNPESFANDGYRIYFADRARGAVLRLSMDGITAISENGMRDYFGDTLKNTTKAIGCFNGDQNEYILSLSRKPGYQQVGAETLSFKEEVQGWTSFVSYIPENGVSINNEFYTFKNGEIWSHDNPVRNNFYGTQYNTKVSVMLNDMPEAVKGYKTLNYEGTESFWKGDTTDGFYQNNQTSFGWWCTSITSDLQEGHVNHFKDKEGKKFNYIMGTNTSLSNLDTKEFSVQGIGSYSSISGDTTVSDITITVIENND